MTIINGANHHEVEDILASIRTSIAEDQGPARLVAGDMHYPVRREQHQAEEASEFELPAIFKPGHNSSPDKPKLFGRLSDALKTASAQDGGRTRTVIPFDPSAAGRMLEPPASHMASRSQPVEPARPQPQAQPQPQQEVKRVMPTFFDTRINRLGELTRQAYEPKAPEQAPQQPEPEPAPAQLRHAVPHNQPPAIPDGPITHHATEAIDDAAAQLLRPMLRQWLQDNMPKIVEKALLSEVQGHPSPKPRK